MLNACPGINANQAKYAAHQKVPHSSNSITKKGTTQGLPPYHQAGPVTLVDSPHPPDRTCAPHTHLTRHVEDVHGVSASLQALHAVLHLFLVQTPVIWHQPGIQPTVIALQHVQGQSRLDQHTKSLCMTLTGNADD